jgi:hypothetical protein
VRSPPPRHPGWSTMSIWVAFTLERRLLILSRCTPTRIVRDI